MTFYQVVAADLDGARMNRSLRNTIATGDAENDLSMMAAEMGAAVANAVASVKAHADVVLDDQDGKGVARLLDGPIVSGARRWCPMRRWVDIGVFEDQTPARLPGSRGRIVVAPGCRRPRPFTVAGRRPTHIRRRHNYADVALRRELRFYLHAVDGQAAEPAATMREFGDAVSG